MGEPLAGFGSVCRRESTTQIGVIAGTLARESPRLHGFGVKAGGLAMDVEHLVSADSMAWSTGARRRRIRLRSCTHAAADRGPSLTHALVWREHVLADQVEAGEAFHDATMTQSVSWWAGAADVDRALRPGTPSAGPPRVYAPSMGTGERPGPAGTVFIARRPGGRAVS
ncbi:hypothetical protein [Embleya sp. NPDC020630]|uniref:deazapurine DNA modification protein DpdA family protein n=1 Tax=Embleya sp. NPDC020630 TaxID=3363979 RepID=UPI0037968715